MNLIIAREKFPFKKRKEKKKGLLVYLIRSLPSSKSSPTLFFPFSLFFDLSLKEEKYENLSSGD